MLTSFFALVALAVFFIVIGIYKRIDSQQGSSGPIVQIGSAPLIWSLFVVIGGGEYALVINGMLDHGLFGASFLLGLGGALIAISFFSKRFAVLMNMNKTIYTIDFHRIYSSTDLIKDRFGLMSGVLASSFSFFAFFLIYQIQISVGGSIISSITGVSYDLSAILIGVTTIAYVLCGGFPAIFSTDVAQGLLMWLALVIFAAFLIFSGGQDFEIAFQTMLTLSSSAADSGLLLSNGEVLMTFILTLVAAFAGPDLWQRISMAEVGSKKTANSILIAGIIVICLALPLLVLSVEIVSLQSIFGSSTDDPFSKFIKYIGFGNENNQYPAVVTIVFAIGLLAAFLSTADTALMLAVSIALNITKNRPQASGNLSGENAVVGIEYFEHKSRSKNILLIIIGSLGLVSSLLWNEIVVIFYVALGLLSILGLPVLAALLGRGKPALVVFALAGGALIAIVQLLPNFPASGGWWSLLPLAPGLMIFIVPSVSKGA